MQKYGDKSHSDSSARELLMEASRSFALHVASEIAKNRYLITETFRALKSAEMNCLAN